MTDATEHAFLHDPGAWAEPALVADQLAPGLQVETVARLLRSPRLASRASAALARRLGAGSLAELSAENRRLALASTERLARTAIFSGAVWHGRRVRAVVLASEIAALTARHGEAVRTMALRFAALSPNSVAGDELAEDIVHDGARCLAAWIETLPNWVAARVRLKWRAAEPPLADPRAVAIVRAVAMEAGA